MIGISADFDPVHKGHERLISEARKLAEREKLFFKTRYPEGNYPGWVVDALNSVGIYLNE